MYMVPVIPPDLRHEETILQAANALDCLQSSITQIFNRIDIRILKSSTKIDELSSRINLASIKIQKLSGTNKAIKIFSTTKFPSLHVFNEFEVMFVKCDASANIRQDYEIGSRVDPAPNIILEKLLFFHFRTPRNESAVKVKVSPKTRDISKIHEKINSINSILLYNTEEKVFCCRRLVSKMNVGQRNQKKDVLKLSKYTHSRPLIEPPPLSLSRRNYEKRFLQSLFYTPTLIEAPVIDLPVDLPDLPGIVDDIQFDHSVNYQIAPSLCIKNITELPDILDHVNVIAECEEKDKSCTTEIKTTIKAVSSPSPLSNRIAEIAIPSNILVPPSPLLPPPPPPPPPPPQKILPPSTVPSPREPSKYIVTKPEDDMRSSLMDAIRKAGGATGGRLRAASDVAWQQSTHTLNRNSQNSKTIKDVDLMADLHNKLLMRRRGISGSKNAENVLDNDTVLYQLSALIPPPTPESHALSSDDEENGNDTDWAD